MKTEIEAIHWSMIRDNPFNRRIHFAMLSSSGYSSLEKVRKRGESRYAKGVGRHVFYDRNYVLAWLVSKIITNFNFLDREELVKLVTEAWDDYYAQNN